MDYIDINRESWNNRTDAHLTSEFYDVPGFLGGKTSLNEIELEFLTDLKGKDLLHLQCHFGQDTLSLARMGASVTGVDLSDKAIAAARDLAVQTGLDAQFICCDVYDLPNQLDKKFDLVFSSYGTIGWLPDINRWAAVVARFLKPGGKFVFAEFHPVVWMYDDNFEGVKYAYHNTGPILETEEGTYAERDAPIKQDYVMWNHGLAEVISALLAQGLTLTALREYDYSPYNCFLKTEEFAPGKFRIQPFGNKLPLVYALVAESRG